MELTNAEMVTSAAAGEPLQSLPAPNSDWGRGAKESKSADVSQGQQRRFVVGEKYDAYYQEQFAQIERGERSLNWAAGCFNVVWLFYRRQNMRALVMFGVLFMLQLPALLLARSNGIGFWATPAGFTASILPILPLWLYLLFSSNKTYLKYVDHRIARTKARFDGATPRTALCEGMNASVWRALVYITLLSLPSNYLRALIVTGDPSWTNFAKMSNPTLESVGRQVEMPERKTQAVQKADDPDAAHEQPTASTMGRHIVKIATLTGTCEKLIAAGKDLTDGCSGTIVQSIYDDGRTSFNLSVGDKGTTITLSGVEGVKPNEDSQTQSVDKVLVNLGMTGVEPTVVSVSGSCLYSNPYKGSMLISCTIADAAGLPYELNFRTDGEPPSILEMKSPAPLVAASFNCLTPNLSGVERAICSDGELSALDATMAKLYRQARADQRSSVAEQRAWLVVRARCGASADVIECLRSAYHQRIGELQ